MLRLPLDFDLGAEIHDAVGAQVVVVGRRACIACPMVNRISGKRAHPAAMN